MATSQLEPIPEVVTEAIVVVDLVESTLTSNLFGWYAVGRHAFRDLRSLIGEVGDGRGLRCMRSTGDGYLLTFHDAQSAEMAAIRAVEAVFELLNRILMRNREVSEERALNLRCAVHLGEVDVVPNDREGPHVSMTFRLEEISRAALPMALNPIPPEQFPLRDYVLCSEEIAGILERRARQWQLASIGLFRLKGFPGWREVFRILPEPHRKELQQSASDESERLRRL
jgi:class 3 adenylate cyclase